MSRQRPAARILAAGLVGLLGLVAAGPTCGQGPGRPDRRVPSPAVENDLPYADGGDERKLDLYIPGRERYPTIVFTFGGGWHTGGRKSVAAIGARLRDAGFGCALPSHRLSPKDKFPAQAEDVAAAFAWVKRHIAERGGDPGRVFLMGHSSGAHLSLLLAADPKYLAKHGLSRRDIAGVVGLSVPVDLKPRADGKGFGDALMKGRGADVFSRDADVMTDASPIRHVSEGMPPVLLIVGGRDFPMLEQDARAFIEKARGLGLSADLFVVEDRDHMGVVRSLIEGDSPVWRQVSGFLSRR
jgi:acetyl esterase/lipase